MGLPQVANAGGNEGVAPEVIARIEREIEATVDQSDVGISVYKDPVTGKTTYHSELTGTGLPSTSGLTLDTCGPKQQQAEEVGEVEKEEGGEAEEDEGEEEETNPVPAPQPKPKAVPSMRIPGLAARLASGRKRTNWNAAFPPPLDRSMVEDLPKAGWCKPEPVFKAPEPVFSA